MTPNSTEERIALKACPFCGQPAEAVVFCKGQANERLGVRCSDHVCGGTVRLGDKTGDSILLWNSRASLTRTDNDVSGLVEALEATLAAIYDAVSEGDPKFSELWNTISAALAKHRQSNGGEK